MKNPIEIRSLPAEIRVLPSEDGGAPRLQGLAVRWNSLSEDLGGFREQFTAGAFRESLESGDPRVYWQHDKKCVFGRVKRGTARIWEDEEGLRYTAEPPDAVWARDAMESIRRGDVDQNSFGFIVPRGGDRWERRDSTLIRTVVRAQLYEVGPQTEPAYSDTTVALRELSRALQQAKNPAAEIEILTRELDLTMAGARAEGLV